MSNSILEDIQKLGRQDFGIFEIYPFQLTILTILLSKYPSHLVKVILKKVMKQLENFHLMGKKEK